MTTASTVKQVVAENGHIPLEHPTAKPPDGRTRAIRQWSNLAAAALQCWWAARGIRNKQALTSYMLTNLMRRSGFDLPVAEEITIRLGNIQVRFRPFQGELYLYKEIFIDRVYERHPSFRVCPGWCVFDVGANIGIFTLKAACQHGAAQTYAFEPDPETFVRLLKNLWRNGLSNVVAIQKAVGKAPGVARFTRGSASTVGHLGAAPGQLIGSELTVDVVSLSSVIQQEKIPVVNLLKLDVEGAEVDALQGAEPVLDRIERVVVESHSADLLRECEHILQRHEFRKAHEAPPSYAYFLKDIF